MGWGEEKEENAHDCQLEKTQISLSKNLLTLFNGEEELLKAEIVSGCDDSATPPNTYKAGQWKLDPIDPRFGPIPWSKDQWGNPYGPYFLELLDDKTGIFTTYGIHGTRGEASSTHVKPPVSEEQLTSLLSSDTVRGVIQSLTSSATVKMLREQGTKYLYCSHGCIRISNVNITKLFYSTKCGQQIGQTIKSDINSIVVEK